VQSDPKKLVEAMLGDEGDFDPKEMAMSTKVGSEAFEELMGNFNEHMHDLVERARKSGALSGDEKEFVVLKCLLVIAANDFFLPTAVFKETLRNLKKFL
jgi:hypothetical protein